jgi:hypothetical protein
MKRLGRSVAGKDDHTFTINLGISPAEESRRFKELRNYSWRRTELMGLQHQAAEAKPKSIAV